MKIREIIETQQDNNLSLGTMPTTEYVKGIYAAAAENGMGAPDVEAVKKQMVLAPNGEVDIMKTMQRSFQVFQNPQFKKMLADLEALIKKAEGMSVKESATAGATSTANIGTVVNPHISPGPARGKKSYLGSPTTGSGTKSPPQPKVVQPKNKDGTAKSAHDIKGASLFGGPTIKRR